MRWVVLVVLTLFLCACASKMSHDYDDFSIQEFYPSNSHREVLARAELAYEQGGRNAVRPMIRDIARTLNDPGVAKFFLDNNIGTTVDLNYRRHLNSQALETMIGSGEFTPYLRNYWRGIGSQRGVNWYRLRFIVPATEWVAENGDRNDRLFAKRELIDYYYHGCPESSTAKPSHRDAPFGLGLCNPAKERMHHWFLSLVLDSEISQSEKFETAFNVAERYFREEAYDQAASWYLAALELSTTDYGKLITSDMPSLSALIFRGGQSLDEAMRESLTVARSQYMSRVRTANRRLRLIRNAGVEVMPVVDIERAEL